MRNAILFQPIGKTISTIVSGPQGPYLAVTATNRGFGDGSWVDSNNILNSTDSLYTSFTSPGSAGTFFSDYLQLQNFGFNIPSGFNINGIEVKIKAYANVDGSATSYDFSLYFGNYPNGTNYGTCDPISISNTPTVYTIGGPTFKWDSASGFPWNNESMTNNILNNTSFGVVFSFNVETPAAAISVYVDYIDMKVYF